MTEQPVAIVTGAGSGIGRAVCELLAAASYRLVLVGRTESSLEETVTRLGEQSASPSDVLIVPADVSDAAQARMVIDMTRDRWGRVDALINNAGAAPSVPIEDTNEDLMFQTFAVNTFGSAYLIAACWPLFRKQGGGCVVNVSSMAASDPFPGLAVYAASKAGVESLVRSVMNEGGSFGMRAFAVAPGPVETAMLRRIVTKDQLAEEDVMTPREVARVICDCVTGRRDDQLGSVIVMRGGLMQRWGWITGISDGA